MIVRIVLACAVLIVFSTSAHAEKGLYLSGNVGAAILANAEATYPEFDYALSLYKSSYNSGDNHFDVRYKHEMAFEAGPSFSLAIGTGSGRGARFEAEVLYQENDLDSADVTYLEDIYIESYESTYSNDMTLSGKDVISGNISCLAFMANGYYDFVNRSAFTPFVGAGFGVAKIEYDISSLFMYYYMFKFDDDYNALHLDKSGDGNVLAFQLSAGVGYAFNDRWTFDLKYRYFATDDPNFGDVTIQYNYHNIFLGFRYGF